MDHPHQVKLGKVGESASELANCLREKGKDKGWDVSEDEIQELEETVKEAQEMAEDDEDIAEQIEKMSGETVETENQEEKDDSEDESDSSTKNDDLPKGLERGKLEEYLDYYRNEKLDQIEEGVNEISEEELVIDRDRSVKNRRREVIRAFEEGVDTGSIMSDIHEPENLNKEDGVWVFSWTSEDGEYEYVEVHEILENDEVLEEDSSVKRDGETQSREGEFFLEDPKDLTEIAPEEYEEFETKNYKPERISYVYDKPGYDEIVIVFEHRTQFVTEERDELRAVGYQTYLLGEGDKFKSENVEEVWEACKAKLDRELKMEKSEDRKDYYAKVGDKIEVKGKPPGVFFSLSGEWVIVQIKDHSKGDAVVLGATGKRKPVLAGSLVEGRNREIVLKSKLEKAVNAKDPEFSSFSREENNGVFLRERGIESEYIKGDTRKESEEEDSSVKNEGEDIENLESYLDWYETFLRDNEFYIKSERGDIDFDASVKKRRNQIIEAFNEGIDPESELIDGSPPPEKLDKKNGKWSFVWTSEITGNDSFVTINESLDSAIVSESGEDMSREYSPRKTDIITQIKDKVQPVVDEHDGWQLDQTGDSFTVHDGENHLQIEAREDYYALFGDDLENMVEAQGLAGTHEVKKDGDKFLRKYGSNHDVRDFIEFYNEEFPVIQETHDSPYVFGLFDRENDYKEIVFVENREDDKFTSKVLDLENSEDRFQVLGSNGRKTRYDFMEAKKIVDSYIDEDRDTVEVIHAENEGEISEEFIEDNQESSEESEDDDFDNMQAVKKLTRQGVIVERDAVDEIKPGDVEIIESLETTPMFLSATMLRKLRDQKGDISGSKTVDIETGDLEYANVEIIGDVPEFMGMDGDVYGGYDGGEQVTLPDANAEILVNRGLAERVEDEEDSSVKSDLEDGIKVSNKSNEKKKEILDDLEGEGIYLKTRKRKNKLHGVMDGFGVARGSGMKTVSVKQKNDTAKVTLNWIQEIGESERGREVKEYLEEKEEERKQKKKEKQEEEERKDRRDEISEKYTQKIKGLDVTESDSTEIIDFMILDAGEKFIEGEISEDEYKSMIEDKMDEKVEENSRDKEGYVEVEFLHKTPQFMGTDLEQYGGFEKGDVAEIPEDNAEILENRGNVEVKGGSANVAEEHNQSSRDKNGSDSSFEGASENEELRDAMQEIGEFIEENGTKDDPVSYDEVYDSLSIEDDVIEKALERLSANGETYEPKKNHVLTI
jgi:hypothetical protein